MKNIFNFIRFVTAICLLFSMIYLSIKSKDNKYCNLSEVTIELDENSFVTNDLIENEYNLNIPRYVDTFEEEEPVDLEAVSNKLQSIENDISETDKTISDFCGELNIKPPF